MKKKGHSSEIRAVTTLISVAGNSVLLVAQTVKNLRAVQETRV